MEAKLQVVAEVAEAGEGAAAAVMDGERERVAGEAADSMRKGEARCGEVRSWALGA